ncbi:MAG: ABC transporter permease [Dehalococcoidia bacterium]|nr:ABC transporter permease [Dehalococcoidia bacterium]
MNAYIIKRLLLFIPTMVLISVVVFVIMRLIPGDPAIQLLSGALGDANYTSEDLAKLRAKLGTDRHIVVQYGNWVWDMLRLDFGTSLLQSTPIADDLKDRFPITIELAIMALIMASVVAVPLGIFSAVNQDKIGDYIARIIAIAGVAMPTFWTGILLIFFLVLVFDWLPPLGYVDIWEDPLKNLQQLIFPAIALGFIYMAFLPRLTRSAMLEVFREDYIRTARSKGLSERWVIARHALRNALLPVVTVSGWQFGFLISGSDIIESMFNVPGVRKIMHDSINQRDYTQTQAAVKLITFVVVALNLVTDLKYGWLDPRIRYR